MNEKSKLDEQIVAWCRSADSQSLSHSVSLSLTLENGIRMHEAEQLKMAAASLLLPSDARLGSLIPRGTPSGRGTTCSPPPPWSGATIVGGGGDDVVDKRHRGHHDARRRKRDTDAAQRPLPAPPCSRRRRVVARCFGWVDSESGRVGRPTLSLPLFLLPFFPRAASCRGMRCRIAEIAVAAVVNGGLDGGPGGPGGVGGVLVGAGAHLERRKNERTTKNEGGVAAVGRRSTPTLSSVSATDRPSDHRASERRSEEREEGRKKERGLVRRREGRCRRRRARARPRSPLPAAALHNQTGVRFPPRLPCFPKRGGLSTARLVCTVLQFLDAEQCQSCA